MAKQFAKFLNNVQGSSNDLLGSFLVENEWDRYEEDAKDTTRSLELAGFVLGPMVPTDKMIANADRDISSASSLMGQKGVRTYITAVYTAMIEDWQRRRDPNLILDIFALALARASAPGGRSSNSFDSSYRRFMKSADEILKEIEKTGYIILPDEPTSEMVSAGVSETANHVSKTQIGADPKYVEKLFVNVIDNRPDDCRAPN